MNVKQRYATILAGVLFLASLLVVVHDSLSHFDRELVELKRKHHSGQRNWNIHYGQENVFFNSSIRYSDDFERMKELMDTTSVVISDLATSYYAASYLPVYIVNIHSHQGRLKDRSWAQFLDKQYLCYLEFEENREIVRAFLKNRLRGEYFIVNKDDKNANRYRDCLAFRSETLIKELPQFSTLLVEGEYLNLYRIDVPNSVLKK